MKASGQLLEGSGPESWFGHMNWRKGHEALSVGAALCSEWHIYDHAWLNRRQQSLNDRHKPGDKRYLITGEYEDSKLVPRQILLIPKILIGSYQDIKEFFGSAQQFAVLYSCPSHLLHSRDVQLR
jgi:hypothetical protein